MADVKVSALTDATAVVDADEFLIVQSGVSKRLTAAELGTYMGSELAGTFLGTAHEADTTSVHGIADTSTLYRAGGADVAVADGGTGASTAADARTNLGTNDATNLTTGTVASGRLPATADTNARIAVEKAGVLVGTRRAINFIEGSNVTLTIADDAGNEEVDVTIAASGGGGSAVRSLQHPFSKINSYSRSYPSPGQPATQGMTLNRMYFIPLLLWDPITIDRIGISVSTGGSAGAVIRLGIYNADSNGEPSTLILDAGTVSSTGVANVEATVSQALSAGFYWFAAVAQVASCSVHADAALAFTPKTTLSIYSNVDLPYRDGTSGALPNPAAISGLGNVGSMPVIAYRRSA